MTKAIATIAGLVFAAAAHAQPTYRQVASIPLGAPDHWDYVVADPPTSRVYVAHGDRITVINTDTDTVVGEILGIPGGTHGVAISQGRGFTDDGKNGKLVAFDPATRTITGTITADDDADAVVADPVTGHVLSINGDPGTITVVDPVTGKVVATIRAGEKMEYAAADGKGAVYVAGEARRDLLKIDARTNRVVARWATPSCESPHGLAVDSASQRIFMGCVNGLMMVVDAKSGRVVAQLKIGLGSDAIALDTMRHLVFSANGKSGTISVFRAVSTDRYVMLDPIPTMLSARTMAVNPGTGKLYVAAAVARPGATPSAKATIEPGTLRVHVYAP